MSIKQRVFSGLKWSALSKLFTQLISWFSTFFVIRLLNPEDYGVVAIASLLFSFATIFAVNGFVSALIKEQEKSPKLASDIFTLSLAIYTAFALIIIYFADNIGQFYQSTDVALVLLVTAVFLPVNSFTLVPTAFLAIDMNFKTKAICESAAALCSTACALLGAIYGMEYWALILANIIYTLALAIFLSILAPYKYGLSTQLSSSLSTIKFALKLQLNGLIWYTYNKLDTFVIGKGFGMNKLGIYNVAQEIASLPMEKVAAILNQVGFSAFASIANDKEASLRYLKKSMLLLSIVTFPIFWGIAAVAEEFIVIVLTDKWIEAASLTAILAIVCPFKMLLNVIQSYIKAQGAANFILSNTLTAAACTVIGIVLGYPYGLFYTAIGIVAGFILAFIILLIRCNREFKIPLSILTVWIVPCVLSVLMFITTRWIGESSLFEHLHISYIFIIKVITGGLFMTLTYLPLYVEKLSIPPKLKV